MIDVEYLLSVDNRTRTKIKGVFESDFKSFCQWTFYLLERHPLQWTHVQVWVSCFLEDVGRGDITRGIINVKPRFGKSLILALWCAWWLLKNPFCKFLYLSCSDILAREQSDIVRSVLSLPEVNLLWQVTFNQDTNAKGLWRTEEGGYFRAVTTGGQVVGFGAGQLGADWFSGALLIDDPLKPEDIRSIVKMEVMNGRYKRTLRHRVNDPRTPIIVIMQRLHDNDLSGYLLGGGSGEVWHHLRIPGLVDQGFEDTVIKRYSIDWNKGKPYPAKLPPGYVWPEKFSSVEDAGERLAEEVWSAQTMQSPQVSGGSMFRVSWFGRFDRMDVTSGVCARVWWDGQPVNIRMMAVFADTAAKTGEQNDFSVFQLWAAGMDGNLYLLDQLRGKWEAPELKAQSSLFLAKYADRHPRVYGWREVYIEDKSSGIGLIQQLQREWGARVIPIPRSKDKVSRALSALLPLESGLVRIPSDAPWTGEYLSEFAAFSKNMTHAHDDQVDPTLDAIDVLGRTGGVNIFSRVGTDSGLTVN